MTVMTSWDLFDDLRSAQDELLQMNRMYGQRLLPPGQFGQFGQRLEARPSTQAWAPAVDISERPDAYLVTVELPGVKLDDLTITLEDGLLTIQGERQFTSESSEQQYHRVERRYGSFRRSITLPSQVQADAIEASFEDGVLEVVVPKAEEAKPKKISVRAGGSRQQVEAASAPAGDA